MQISLLGLVTALKNAGLFLASYTAAGIQADPGQFCLSLMVYILISVPSDLLLINHYNNHSNTKSG